MNQVGGNSPLLDSLGFGTMFSQPDAGLGTVAVPGAEMIPGLIIALIFEGTKEKTAEEAGLSYRTISSTIKTPNNAVYKSCLTTWQYECVVVPLWIMKFDVHF